MSFSSRSELAESVEVAFNEPDLYLPHEILIEFEIESELIPGTQIEVSYDEVCVPLKGEDEGKGHWVLNEKITAKNVHRLEIALMTICSCANISRFEAMQYLAFSFGIPQGTNVHRLSLSKEPLSSISKLLSTWEKAIKYMDSGEYSDPDLLERLRVWELNETYYSITTHRQAAVIQYLITYTKGHGQPVHQDLILRAVPGCQGLTQLRDVFRQGRVQNPIYGTVVERPKNAFFRIHPEADLIEPKKLES